MRVGTSFGALCIGLALVAGSHADARLINGTPVEPGTWPQVVRLKSSKGNCTATIVGPRAVITAAHCAANGSQVTIIAGAKTYDAKITLSDLYPGRDHDIAIAVTSTEISGIKPTSISKAKATSGLELTLLGYGCTQPGGGGGNDGILRIGKTAVTGFTGYDMVSRMANGAALCYGDSGGPSYMYEGTKATLIGINSKGNIQDTNYNTRLDIDESQKFLTKFASTNSVQICGINSKCEDDIEPAKKPSCTLTASPSSIKIGGSLTLSLVTMNTKSATLDEATVPMLPNYTKMVTPSAVGKFTAKAVVTGEGGTDMCQAVYEVTKTDDPDPIKPPPTCTITATPNEAAVGTPITLEIVATGNADYASIDGSSVALPVGRKIVTPKAKGDYSATGFVRGPGGSQNCFSSYKITDDGTEPPPTIPNFAVITAYCGENSPALSQSQVSTVCLAVLKKDLNLLDLKIPQVLLITFRDGSQEVLPIISRRTRPKTDGEATTREDMTVYANAHVKAPGYVVADTREALLSKVGSTNDGAVPLSIQGKSGKGSWAFLVDNLKANGTAH